MRCTKSCAPKTARALAPPRAGFPDRGGDYIDSDLRESPARGARRFRQPWLRPWTLRLSRSNLLPQFEARRTHGTEPDIVVGVVRVVVVALRATAVVGVVVPVAAAQQTIRVGVGITPPQA